MRTIGLIGGTSWISTIDYYRVINKTINESRGGFHSGKILLYSVNHDDYKLSPEPNWKEVTINLSNIAKTLEQGGADCLLICANTMHLVAEDIQKNISIPLIHIVKETGKSIKNKKLQRVGILGTRITMEHSFFKDVLAGYGIEILIPEKEDRGFIENTIFTELGKEIFRTETKERYLAIIDKLASHGAEGVILGCTEIPLLIKQEDCRLPVFDTMNIHALAAVEFALNNDQKMIHEY